MVYAVITSSCFERLWKIQILGKEKEAYLNQNEPLDFGAPKLPTKKKPSISHSNVQMIGFCFNVSQRKVLQEWIVLVLQQVFLFPS